MMWRGVSALPRASRGEFIPQMPSSLSASITKAFYVLFANQIDHPSFPKRVCQNNGVGPQGWQCVNLLDYAGGVVILSPENVTAAHVAKLKGAVAGVRVLGYFDVGFIPIKPSDGRCDLGRASARDPQRAALSILPFSASIISMLPIPTASRPHAQLPQLHRAHHGRPARPQLLDDLRVQRRREPAVQRRAERGLPWRVGRPRRQDGPRRRHRRHARRLLPWPGQLHPLQRLRIRPKRPLGELAPAAWLRRHLSGRLRDAPAVGLAPLGSLDWDGDGVPESPQQALDQYNAWAPVFVARLRAELEARLGGREALIIANARRSGRRTRHDEPITPPAALRQTPCIHTHPIR